MVIPDDARAHALDLIAYIDASPSPWHAVRTAADRLSAAGFTQLSEAQRWQLQSGGRYFVVRGGSSVVAFI
ncbi:MAG: M18 family aminopeptidase, partial [Rhodocyclaceae bacterium]